MLSTQVDLREEDIHSIINTLIYDGRVDQVSGIGVLRRAGWVGVFPPLSTSSFTFLELPHTSVSCAGATRHGP